MSDGANSNSSSRKKRSITLDEFLRLDTSESNKARHKAHSTVPKKWSEELPDSEIQDIDKFGTDVEKSSKHKKRKSKSKPQNGKLNERRQDLKMIVNDDSITFKKQSNSCLPSAYERCTTDNVSMNLTDASKLESKTVEKDKSNSKKKLKKHKNKSEAETMSKCEDNSFPLVKASHPDLCDYTPAKNIDLKTLLKWESSSSKKWKKTNFVKKKLLEEDVMTGFLDYSFHRDQEDDEDMIDVRKKKGPKSDQTMLALGRKRSLDDSPITTELMDIIMDGSPFAEKVTKPEVFSTSKHLPEDKHTAVETNYTTKNKTRSVEKAAQTKQSSSQPLPRKVFLKDIINEDPSCSKKEKPRKVDEDDDMRLIEKSVPFEDEDDEDLHSMKMSVKIDNKATIKVDVSVKVDEEKTKASGFKIVESNNEPKASKETSTNQQPEGLERSYKKNKSKSKTKAVALNKLLISDIARGTKHKSKSLAKFDEKDNTSFLRHPPKQKKTPLDGASRIKSDSLSFTKNDDKSKTHDARIESSSPKKNTILPGYVKKRDDTKTKTRGSMARRPEVLSLPKSRPFMSKVFEDSRTNIMLTKPGTKTIKKESSPSKTPPDKAKTKKTAAAKKTNERKSKTKPKPQKALVRKVSNTAYSVNSKEGPSSETNQSSIVGEQIYPVPEENETIIYMKKHPKTLSMQISAKVLIKKSLTKATTTTVKTVTTHTVQKNIIEKCTQFLNGSSEKDKATDFASLLESVKKTAIVIEKKITGTNEHKDRVKDAEDVISSTKKADKIITEKSTSNSQSFDPKSTLSKESQDIPVKPQKANLPKSIKLRSAAENRISKKVIEKNTKIVNESVEKSKTNDLGMNLDLSPIKAPSDIQKSVTSISDSTSAHKDIVKDAKNVISSAKQTEPQQPMLQPETNKTDKIIVPKSLSDSRSKLITDEKSTPSKSPEVMPVLKAEKNSLPKPEKASLLKSVPLREATEKKTSNKILKEMVKFSMVESKNIILNSTQIVNGSGEKDKKINSNPILESAATKSPFVIEKNVTKTTTIVNTNEQKYTENVISSGKQTEQQQQQQQQQQQFKTQSEALPLPETNKMEKNIVEKSLSKSRRKATSHEKSTPSKPPDVMPVLKAEKTSLSKSVAENETSKKILKSIAESFPLELKNIIEKPTRILSGSAEKEKTIDLTSKFDPSAIKHTIVFQKNVTRTIMIIKTSERKHTKDIRSAKRAEQQQPKPKSQPLPPPETRKMDKNIVEKSLSKSRRKATSHQSTSSKPPEVMPVLKTEKTSIAKSASIEATAKNEESEKILKEMVKFSMVESKNTIEKPTQIVSGSSEKEKTTDWSPILESTAIKAPFVIQKNVTSSIVSTSEQKDCVKDAKEIISSAKQTEKQQQQSKLQSQLLPPPETNKIDKTIVEKSLSKSRSKRPKSTIKSSTREKSTSAKHPEVVPVLKPENANIPKSASMEATPNNEMKKLLKDVAEIKNMNEKATQIFNGSGEKNKTINLTPKFESSATKESVVIQKNVTQTTTIVKTSEQKYTKHVVSSPKQTEQQSKPESQQKTVLETATMDKFMVQKSLSDSRSMRPNSTINPASYDTPTSSKHLEVMPVLKPEKRSLPKSILAKLEAKNEASNKILKEMVKFSMVESKNVIVNPTQIVSGSGEKDKAANWNPILEKTATKSPFVIQKNVITTTTIVKTSEQKYSKHVISSAKREEQQLTKAQSQPLLLTNKIEKKIVEKSLPKSGSKRSKSKIKEVLPVLKPEKTSVTKSASLKAATKNEASKKILKDIAELSPIDLKNNIKKSTNIVSGSGEKSKLGTELSPIKAPLIIQKNATTVVVNSDEQKEIVKDAKNVISGTEQAEQQQKFKPASELLPPPETSKRDKIIVQKSLSKSRSNPPKTTSKPVSINEANIIEKPTHIVSGSGEKDKTVNGNLILEKNPTKSPFVIQTNVIKTTTIVKTSEQKYSKQVISSAKREEQQQQQQSEPKSQLLPPPEINKMDKIISKKSLSKSRSKRPESAIKPSTYEKSSSSKHPERASLQKSAADNEIAKKIIKDTEKLSQVELKNTVEKPPQIVSGPGEKDKKINLNPILESTATKSPFIIQQNVTTTIVKTSEQKYSKHVISSAKREEQQQQLKPQSQSPTSPENSKIDKKIVKKSLSKSRSKRPELAIKPSTIEKSTSSKHPQKISLPKSASLKAEAKNDASKKILKDTEKLSPVDLKNTIEKPTHIVSGPGEKDKKMDLSPILEPTAIKSPFVIQKNVTTTTTIVKTSEQKYTKDVISSAKREQQQQQPLKSQSQSPPLAMHETNKIEKKIVEKSLSNSRSKRPKSTIKQSTYEKSTSNKHPEKTSLPKSASLKAEAKNDASKKILKDTEKLSPVDLKNTIEKPTEIVSGSGEKDKTMNWSPILESNDIKAPFVIEKKATTTTNIVKTIEEKYTKDVISSAKPQEQQQQQQLKPQSQSQPLPTTENNKIEKIDSNRPKSTNQPSTNEKSTSSKHPEVGSVLKPEKASLSKSHSLKSETKNEASKKILPDIVKFSPNSTQIVSGSGEKKETNNLSSILELPAIKAPFVIQKNVTSSIVRTSEHKDSVKSTKESNTKQAEQQQQSKLQSQSQQQSPPEASNMNKVGAKKSLSKNRKNPPELTDKPTTYVKSTSGKRPKVELKAEKTSLPKPTSLRATAENETTNKILSGVAELLPVEMKNIIEVSKSKKVDLDAIKKGIHIITEMEIVKELNPLDQLNPLKGIVDVPIGVDTVVDVVAAAMGGLTESKKSINTPDIQVLVEKSVGKPRAVKKSSEQYEIELSEVKPSVREKNPNEWLSIPEIPATTKKQDAHPRPKTNIKELAAIMKQKQFSGVIFSANENPKSMSVKPILPSMDQAGKSINISRTIERTKSIIKGISYKKTDAPIPIILPSSKEVSSSARKKLQLIHEDQATDLTKILDQTSKKAETATYSQSKTVVTTTSSTSLFEKINLFNNAQSNKVATNAVKQVIEKTGYDGKTKDEKSTSIKNVFEQEANRSPKSSTLNVVHSEAYGYPPSTKYEKSYNIQNILLPESPTFPATTREEKSVSNKALVHSDATFYGLIGKEDKSSFHNAIESDLSAKRQKIKDDKFINPNDIVQSQMGGNRPGSKEEKTVATMSPGPTKNDANSVTFRSDNSDYRMQADNARFGIIQPDSAGSLFATKGKDSDSLRALIEAELASYRAHGKEIPSGLSGYHPPTKERKSASLRGMLGSDMPGFRARPKEIYYGNLTGAHSGTHDDKFVPLGGMPQADTNGYIIYPKEPPSMLETSKDGSLLVKKDDKSMPFGNKNDSDASSLRFNQKDPYPVNQININSAEASTSRYGANFGPRSSSNDEGSIGLGSIVQTEISGRRYPPKDNPYLAKQAIKSDGTSLLPTSYTDKALTVIDMLPPANFGPSPVSKDDKFASQKAAIVWDSCDYGNRQKEPNSANITNVIQSGTTGFRPTSKDEKSANLKAVIKSKTSGARSSSNDEGSIGLGSIVQQDTSGYRYLPKDKLYPVNQAIPTEATSLRPTSGTDKALTVIDMFPPATSGPRSIAKDEKFASQKAAIVWDTSNYGNRQKESSSASMANAIQLETTGPRLSSDPDKALTVIDMFPPAILGPRPVTKDEKSTFLRPKIEYGSSAYCSRETDSSSTSGEGSIGLGSIVQPDMSGYRPYPAKQAEKTVTAKGITQQVPLDPRSLEKDELSAFLRAKIEYDASAYGGRRKEPYSTNIIQPKIAKDIENLYWKTLSDLEPETPYPYAATNKEKRPPDSPDVISSSATSPAYKRTDIEQFLLKKIKDGKAWADLNEPIEFESVFSKRPTDKDYQWKVYKYEHDKSGPKQTWNEKSTGADERKGMSLHFQGILGSIAEKSRRAKLTSAPASPSSPEKFELVESSSSTFPKLLSKESGNLVDLRTMPKDDLSSAEKPVFSKLPLPIMVRKDAEHSLPTSLLYPGMKSKPIAEQSTSIHRQMNMTKKSSSNKNDSPHVLKYDIENFKSSPTHDFEPTVVPDESKVHEPVVKSKSDSGRKRSTTSKNQLLEMDELLKEYNREIKKERSVNLSELSAFNSDRGKTPSYDQDRPRKSSQIDFSSSIRWFPSLSKRLNEEKSAKSPSPFPVSPKRFPFPPAISPSSSVRNKIDEMDVIKVYDKTSSIKSPHSPYATDDLFGIALDSSINEKYSKIRYNDNDEFNINESEDNRKYLYGKKKFNMPAGSNATSKVCEKSRTLPTKNGRVVCTIHKDVFCTCITSKEENSMTLRRRLEAAGAVGGGGGGGGGPILADLQMQQQDQEMVWIYQSIIAALVSLIGMIVYTNPNPNPY